MTTDSARPTTLRSDVPAASAPGPASASASTSAPESAASTYRTAQQVETAFDANIRGHALWTVALRGLFGFALIYLGFLIASFVNGTTTTLGLPRPDPGLRSAGLWFGLGYAVICWLVPRHDPLSEWSSLQNGLGGSSERTYAAIVGALRSRQVPARTSLRRMRSERGTVRNYLVVKQGQDAVHISVFPYGTGLYVGWQMWRHQIPVIMLCTWVIQRAAALSPGGTDFRVMLRADQSRALRDAVHLSVREGITAASRGEPPASLSELGLDVPVQNSTRISSPPATGKVPPVPLIPPPPTVPPHRLPPLAPGAETVVNDKTDDNRSDRSSDRFSDRFLGEQ